MFLHDLFFETAKSFPDIKAIQFDEQQLTYRELAERVKSLAYGLAQYVPRQSRVAINTCKSMNTLVMMLACLKAELTYVPIDPFLPMARRQFILQDSNANILILDERTIQDWESESTISTLNLTIGPRPLKSLSQHHFTIEQLAEIGVNNTYAALNSSFLKNQDLAYILYTSGSTGDPKGVKITHRNAAAFVSWGMQYFDLSPGDRVAVHAPFHFDLPIFDIYVSLAKGATIYPIKEQITLFPEALLHFLENNQITVLYAVPSALIALLNRSSLAAGHLLSLRLLLYAGEEFHPTPLTQLIHTLPHTRIFNLYGPIETNVITVCEVLEKHLSLPRIPIGKSILNTLVFLINDQGKIIKEPNVEGELVVNGPSVSPGYLNRPDLTAKSRILVFSGKRQWECYRTGDFAIWDLEGQLHFLGRRDSLIKTRGFRVELGDIEATLLKHPKIAEVAVIAKPHPNYTNLIYAYVVPKPGEDLKENNLLTWCKNQLSSYMIPKEIVVRDYLPKTSTGKIARRELTKLA